MTEKWVNLVSIELFNESFEANDWKIKFHVLISKVLFIKGLLGDWKNNLILYEYKGITWAKLNKFSVEKNNYFSINLLPSRTKKKLALKRQKNSLCFERFHPNNRLNKCLKVLKDWGLEAIL